MVLVIDGSNSGTKDRTTTNQLKLLLFPPKPSTLEKENIFSYKRILFVGDEYPFLFLFFSQL